LARPTAGRVQAHAGSIARHTELGAAELAAWRGSDPAALELLENPSDGCAAILWELNAVDRIVAVQFGLRAASSLSYRFPTYDPAASRHSPGLVLLLMTIGAAGVHRLDLEVGEEEYKRRLMTGEVQVAEGSFERPSPIALIRRLRKGLT
jgi:GNAT acetyltransferase-like protein